MARSRARTAALFAGPLLAAAVALAPTPEGLTMAGQRGLAILVLCVAWWLFTPVALAVTSLLGLALLPLLGVLPPGEAMALFGNQAVFFVVGVFILAAAMLRSGLSSRLALVVLRRAARSEDALAAGVLALSFGLCAVMVSHAVAALLLPIVLEIIRALDLKWNSPAARRLLLSMAWGTILGSNLTLFSSARASLALNIYGLHDGEGSIGFLEFTAATSGLCVLLAITAFLLLRRALPPEGLEIEPVVAELDGRVRGLGPIGAAEGKVMLVLFAMIAGLVTLGGTYGLGTVALFFSVMLFAVGALEWDEAQRDVNWGVVLLYGGAIAIGAGLDRSGAMSWAIHQVLPGAGMPPLFNLFAIIVIGMALTEFVSNAAVIALLLPALLSAAPDMGLDPRALTLVLSVATGLAFVMPTSTPAMAMVFGTGMVTTRGGSVHGILLLVAAAPLFWLFAAFVWPMLGWTVVTP